MYKLSILCCLFSTVMLLGHASPQASDATTRKPGPHFVKVDYEELFAMKQPPAYEPFEVYGMFLMSVAAQQTPLVMNPMIEVPDNRVSTVSS